MKSRSIARARMGSTCRASLVENPMERAIRILRAGDYRRMPWKNGGGETIEIAVSPDGATLDNFDWRVSMARVETDGPFSMFAGVDRTLAILQGAGLSLAISQHPAINVTMGAALLSFDAGAATQARLLGGPIVDLNLMTRRGRFSHRMTCINLADPTLLAVSAQETFLLASDGGVAIETEAGVATLGPRDALHGRAVRSNWRLTPEKPDRVYLLEIFELFDA